MIDHSDSFAAQPDADVAIWTIRMAPGAHWTLPTPGKDTDKRTRRSLYFFKGRPIGELLIPPALPATPMAAKKNRRNLEYFLTRA